MEIHKMVFKYKSSIIILAVFSIISSAAAIIVPYYNGLLIDLLINSENLNKILKYAGFIIIIGLAGAIGLYYVNMIIVKLTAKTSFDMMSYIIGRIQKMPYGIYKNKYNPAYLIQRISIDTNIVFSFFLNNFISIFLYGAMFIIIMYIIACINLHVFFISLLFIPLYIVFYSMLKEPLYKRNLVNKEHQNRYSKTMYEQLDGVREIKLDVSFDKSIKRQTDSFNNYYNSLISYSRVSYIFSSLDSLVGVIFQAAIMIIGGIQIVRGNMTIGEFTIITTYFYTLLNSVKYYFGLGKSYQDYKSSNTRINEILDLKPEINGDEKIDNIKEIYVDNITFSYITGKNVLNEVTAHIYFGKITTIVGPNGAGKTTLLLIITGILQNPDKGQIEFDNININNLDLYEIRNSEMSIMLQNTSYPDMSVEEYLSYNLDLNKNEILMMISFIGLQNMYLEDNFDLTKHWEKKLSSLSTGELQRINFLKTIGKKRRILILDEPTLGIDTTGVKLMMDCLTTIKTDSMIILVSHDQRVIELSDTVINM